MWNEKSKERFWRGYVRQTENYEPRTIKALRGMFKKQKSEALGELKHAVNRDHKLINTRKAKEDYAKTVTPILTAVILNAAKAGANLVEPENPHKQDIPPVASSVALNWLRTRIGWAAELISEETASLLAQELAAGFAAGESMDEIAKRITDTFDFFNEARAQRIARTEIMSASNQGALQGYSESGVVEQVEFYAALDERTCDMCSDMHGETFDIDDAPPLPDSTHPNCRCVYIPIVE